MLMSFLTVKGCLAAVETSPEKFHLDRRFVSLGDWLRRHQPPHFLLIANPPKLWVIHFAQCAPCGHPRRTIGYFDRQIPLGRSPCAKQ